jgi:steroid 5-alpha reductase family enzyme
MTYLLVRCGKALLEKSMEQRPGYREYIESTSGFVPWFPTKAKGKDS